MFGNVLDLHAAYNLVTDFLWRPAIPVNRELGKFVIRMMSDEVFIDVRLIAWYVPGTTVKNLQ